MALYLVRHGRPVPDPALPAHEWPLDPAYTDDVRAVRGRLPEHAHWFSSPEPKAVATARLLTDGPLEIVPDLREHDRQGTGWMEDFDAVAARAFERPDVPAYDGWAPLADTRRRVVTAVAGILDQHRDHDVVLVGHGTAWTLLRAALRGERPDLAWWASLALPDVVRCDVGEHPGDMLAP